jgi:hypothetical protein
MGLSVWFVQIVRNYYPVLIWLSLAVVALIHVFGQYSVQSYRALDVPVYSSGLSQGESQESLLRSSTFKRTLLK